MTVEPRAESPEPPARSERLTAAIGRHPFATVLVVALLLRCTVAIAVSMTGVTINPDEEIFWRLAGDSLTGDTGDWGGYERGVYRQSRAFVWVLLGLQWLVGPHELAGRLVVALIGTGVAVAAAGLAARLWSSRSGLVAGMLVAVWPSYVVFSGLIMKDALVWFALVGLALAALELRRAAGWRLVAMLGGAAGLLALVGLVRATTMMAAAGALLLAVWFARGGWAWRGGIAAGVLAVAIAVPTALGYGIAGVDLIERAPREVEVRIERAQGHHTTFVEPIEDPTYADLARRVPRGVTVMLFEPVPWRDVGTAWGEFGKLEAVAWWVVMVAAGAAVWRRREAFPSLVFPLALLAALVVVGAVGSANIGTAFRHRGEFLWIGLVIASGLVSGSPQPFGRRRGGARPAAPR